MWFFLCSYVQILLKNLQCGIPNYVTSFFISISCHLTDCFKRKIEIPHRHNHLICQCFTSQETSLKLQWSFWSSWNCSLTIEMIELVSHFYFTIYQEELINLENPQITFMHLIGGKFPSPEEHKVINVCNPVKMLINIKDPNKCYSSRPGRCKIFASAFERRGRSFLGS